MEKIEAGFQVSSSEEEGSEESDEEFDINDEPYRQRIAQSEGEQYLPKSSALKYLIIEPYNPGLISCYCIFVFKESYV